MEVAHGRTDMAVAKQTLDSVDIDAGFQQVGREGMPQGVDTTVVGQAGRIAYGTIQTLDGLVVDRTVTGAIGKDPATRTTGPPVEAQRCQQTRREQAIGKRRSEAVWRIA